MSEQRAIERERAGKDQDERRDRENLSRPIDVHERVQHQHRDVDHQIGQHLPFRGVETREIRIRTDVVDDIGPAQVVDVVGKRRQRVGDDRDRRPSQRAQRKELQWSICLKSPGLRNLDSDSGYQANACNLSAGMRMAGIQFERPQIPCIIFVPLSPDPINQLKGRGNIAALHHDRITPRNRSYPLGSPALYAALRRCDRRHQIRRSRHG